MLAVTVKEEGVSEVVSDMWNLNQLSLPRISQLDDTLIDGWERRRKQTGTVPKNVFGRKGRVPTSRKNPRCCWSGRRRRKNQRGNRLLGDETPEPSDAIRRRQGERTMKETAEVWLTQSKSHQCRSRVRRLNKLLPREITLQTLDPT